MKISIINKDKINDVDLEKFESQTNDEVTSLQNAVVEFASSSSMHGISACTNRGYTKHRR